MARYCWKGQGGAGELMGEMTAESKEQVVAFLRTQAILVRWISVAEQDIWAEAHDRRGGPNLRALLVAAFAITALLIFAIPFVSAVLSHAR